MRCQDLSQTSPLDRMYSDQLPDLLATLQAEMEEMQQMLGPGLC